MYSNTSRNFNGKYWAIFGPKYSYLRTTGVWITGVRIIGFRTTGVRITEGPVYEFLIGKSERKQELRYT
jgi:hypothetical protein